MTPYEGTEPFIFISYAHKNSPKVLPLLEALAHAGFRVWYDEGIEAGTEYPAYIQDHLDRCSCVIAFLSPAFVDSKFCRREIHTADRYDKPVLCVVLEKCELKDGLEVLLGNSQSIYRDRHPSDASFVSELMKARLLQSCRERPAEDPPRSSAEHGQASRPFGSPQTATPPPKETAASPETQPNAEPQTLSEAEKEIATLTKRLTYPKMFYLSLAAQICSYIAFALIASESAAFLIFTAAALIVEIPLVKLTKRYVFPKPRLWLSILVVVVGIYYYAIYLTVMAIITWVNKQKWMARLKELKGHLPAA